MSTKRNMGKRNLPDKRKSLVKKKFNGISKLGNQEAGGNKFREILNKKWKVFRVSPIYNFSTNKLKFYERKLNEEMNSKRKVTSNVGYTSKLTLNKNLRLNDQCAEALQVEIKRDSQTTYVGYFISNINFKTKPNAEYKISLPVLLVEGKAHEVSAVHSGLCKIFDCEIQPVTFSFYALITFFVKLLETHRSNIDVTQEQVTMEFKIPECENSDKVKISFSLEAVTIVFAVVMDSLQEKNQGITPIEIILEFYNKILTHVYHIFKMDLMLTELQKIVFPDAFLGKDGQLRMTTDEAVLTTLEVLQRFTPLDSVTVM